MKTYNVRAESTIRYYCNYFYKAKNEDDAIDQFLKEKNATRKRFTRILAECSD